MCSRLMVVVKSIFCFPSPIYLSTHCLPAMVKCFLEILTFKFTDETVRSLLFFQKKLKLDCNLLEFMMSQLFAFPDEEIGRGRRSSNVMKNTKRASFNWEPYFCVLLQDEQSFTTYRSEDLSVSKKYIQVIFLYCSTIFLY